MSKTKKTTIHLATEFSKVPAGRYLTDGSVSGEAFRERLLLPALGRGELVEVVLDGAEGYGSSFLEEAFAGLVRKLNMSSAEFNAKVSFVATEDPSLLEEIALYIADEERRRIAAKS